MTDDKKLLGRILLQQRAITQPELEEALLNPGATGKPLATRLIESGKISEISALKALSEQTGVPGIDLNQICVRLSDLQILPRELAARHKIFPVLVRDDRIFVAMATPSDKKVLDELEFVTGKRVFPYVALNGPLVQVIAAAYDMRDRGEQHYVGPGCPPEVMRKAGITPPSVAPTPTTMNPQPPPSAPAVPSAPPRSSSASGPAGDASVVAKPPVPPSRERDASVVAKPPMPPAREGSVASKQPPPATREGSVVTAPPRQSAASAPRPGGGAVARPATSRLAPGKGSAVAKPAGAPAAADSSPGAIPAGPPSSRASSPGKTGTSGPLVVDDQMDRVASETEVTDTEWGDVGREQSQVTALPPGTIPPAKPGQKTVLVVDDEADIRKLLRRLLEERGYRILEADRGEAALRMVKDVPPDLMILDAMLPEVHGFDIARRMKGAERYAHIPIIMISAVYRGWRFAEDVKASYGVEAYIEKPFKVADVVRAVENALEKRTQQPDAREPERISADAERLLAAGIASYKAGDLDKACEHLLQGTKIDPLAYRLHFHLGLLYGKKGQVYDAIQSLEDALHINGTHFPALKNLAVLYEKAGFRHKAIETWERALRVAPEDARASIKEHLVSLL